MQYESEMRNFSEMKLKNEKWILWEMKSEEVGKWNEAVQRNVIWKYWRMQYVY